VLRSEDEGILSGIIRSVDRQWRTPQSSISPCRARGVPENRPGATAFPEAGRTGERRGSAEAEEERRKLGSSWFHLPSALPGTARGALVVLLLLLLLVWAFDCRRRS